MSQAPEVKQQTKTPMEEVQEQYNGLCASLGDLIYKKELIINQLHGVNRKAGEIRGELAKQEEAKQEAQPVALSEIK